MQETLIHALAVMAGAVAIVLVVMSWRAFRRALRRRRDDVLVWPGADPRERR